MATRKVRPERAYEPTDLDAIDLRIVTELQRDARTSRAEMGRRVGLSAPAVGDRMRRLEEFTPYGQTTTALVQSAPVPPRPLPLLTGDEPGS